MVAPPSSPTILPQDRSFLGTNAKIGLGLLEVAYHDVVDTSKFGPTPFMDNIQEPTPAVGQPYLNQLSSVAIEVKSTNKSTVGVVTCQPLAKLTMKIGGVGNEVDVEQTRRWWSWFC